MQHSPTTVFFETKPSRAILKKIRCFLQKAKITKNTVFVDYRPGEFEGMAFIPVVYVKGDTDNLIECDSCEKKVKTRNCSLVVFERDDEDADPLCFCQSCANMMRQGV